MVKKCPKGHKITGDNRVPYRMKLKDGTYARYFKCKKCKNNNTSKYRKENGDFLGPETKAVMASYKEPLKKISQGHGYYGTIAYDETQQYTQCHICGKFWKHLGKHVSFAHNKPPSQYKLEFDLPEKLSLSAPKFKSTQLERWQNMSEDERQEVIKRLNSSGHNKRPAAQKRRRHRKSLYYRNLEGRCPDQLLDKIVKLKEKLGHQPRLKEFMKEYGKGHRSSIRVTFGTYGEALKILGMNPRLYKNHSPYNEEILLKMLRDFKKTHNREAMTSDLHRGILPNVKTFYKYFGNFTQAKEQAYGKGKKK